MFIIEVIKFARKYHEGQMRKYTKEAYIFHPINVGFILSMYTTNQDIIGAGILHDVIEDTDATEGQLSDLFGERITGFVMDVTDVSKPSDGNRKVRKEIDRQHLEKAAPESKTIKLADIFDNARSIIKYDPGFARVWMQEKKELLPDLKDGNSKLWKITNDIIQ